MSFTCVMVYQKGEMIVNYRSLVVLVWCQQYLVGAEAIFPLDGAEGNFPLVLAPALAAPKFPVLVLPADVDDARRAALLLRFC